MSKEKIDEINLTNLCFYDRRNPDFSIKEEYGYDKEEVETTGNFAKEDCACDNCFYGRSKLTEQLILQQERMYSGIEISDKVLFEQATVAMEEWYGYGCETEIDAYFRGLKWIQSQFKKK